MTYPPSIRPIRYPVNNYNTLSANLTIFLGTMLRRDETKLSLVFSNQRCSLGQTNWVSYCSKLRMTALDNAACTMYSTSRTYKPEKVKLSATSIRTGSMSLTSVWPTTTILDSVAQQTGRADGPSYSKNQVFRVQWRSPKGRN